MDIRICMHHSNSVQYGILCIEIWTCELANMKRLRESLVFPEKT